MGCVLVAAFGILVVIDAVYSELPICHKRPPKCHFSQHTRCVWNEHCEPAYICTSYMKVLTNDGLTKNCKNRSTSAPRKKAPPSSSLLPLPAVDDHPEPPEVPTVHLHEPYKPLSPLEEVDFIRMMPTGNKAKTNPTVSGDHPTLPWLLADPTVKGSHSEDKSKTHSPSSKKKSEQKPKKKSELEKHTPGQYNTYSQSRVQPAIEGLLVHVGDQGSRYEFL